MYFLPVGPLIKLRPGALVGTSIIVTIELSIAKVIRILNFNHILILSASNKGLKGLIKLYIIYLTIHKLVNIIYSLPGVFQIFTVQVIRYILMRLFVYFIGCHIIRSSKLVNNGNYIFVLPPWVMQ